MEYFGKNIEKNFNPGEKSNGFFKDNPAQKHLDLNSGLEIFKKMLFSRYFEKQIKQHHDTNLIKCPVYLSIGQESPSATISLFFKPDLIFTQHRGHSVYLNFGGNRGKLIDELLGKECGCNQGKGGSPGIQDLNIGMMGHHGLIGENVPLAVGAALGDSSKKVFCVFGDGAAEEDYVLTAMAFAFTHKLKILFLCEDNDLSILTKKVVRRNWELVDVLNSIGMPSADIIDDPELISDTVNKFKENLPAFINCRTQRHLWHVGTGKDDEPEKDRLEIFKDKLIQNGALKTDIEKMEFEIKSEVEELWKKHLPKQ